MNPAYAADECCALHVPDGFCCDPDTCDPCCSQCPTCPTAHNMRGGGALPRVRDQRGAANLISSLLVVIGLCIAIRLATGYNPIHLLDVAATWGLGVVRDIIAYVGARS